MIDLRLAPGAPVRLCGHRGGMATAPENTLAALRQCRERGGAAAEIDVRLTADGALVLMHDARLERTTDARGLVAAATRADLAGVDAGGWFGADWVGEPVPTLDDAVACARDLGLILRVELKTYGRDAALLDALAPVLEAAPPVVLCSFDHVQLAAARARFPDVATMGLLQLRTRATAAAIRAAGLQGISVVADRFDAEMGQAAHAEGAAISCAFPLPRRPDALDAEEAARTARIRHWAETGAIDMITTDDIALCRALLEG